MPYTYIQYKDKVSEIVQDKAEKISAIERDGFIQEAIKSYNKHRPREVVKDITGTGSYDYAISTNMTLWVKGFSVIKKIEYPADQRVPEYMDERSFIIYEKEAGQYLRFFKDTPLTTEKIRVTYTALHILTTAANTIPESDQDAVCNLAASFYSGALASFYAHSADSTIGADSVDHRSKSQEFASAAKRQKKNYNDHLGIKEGEVPPASGTSNWDSDYPGGDDRLTHPRRWR